MVETEEMTSAAQVDSAKEPNRSAPIPAMSPTLSPTLSAWRSAAIRSGNRIEEWHSSMQGPSKSLSRLADTLAKL